MPNYYSSLTAFDSLSVAVQTSTNNIANVSTNGYKSEYTILQSGPNDQGVQLARIAKDMNPGPAVITSIDEVASRAAHESQVQGMKNRTNAYSHEMAMRHANVEQSDSINHWQQQEVRAYDEAVGSHTRHYLEGSNTDIPRDFVNLNMTDMAYTANAAAIRANDDLTGTLLNIMG